MKALEKQTRGVKHLIFFDLEGTGKSHEIIEIGAVVATLRADGSIKKVSRGFQTYVKAKHPIGKFVTQLTGITEEKLQKEGKSYHDAMNQFRKFCGRYMKSCMFVSFGRFDITLLEKTVYANFDDHAGFVKFIKRNYMDYSAFISTYIKDSKNNPMSLTNYLKFFNVNFSGTQHDALDDARNLGLLYQAFLDNPEKVSEAYKQTLSQLRHLPEPIRKVLIDLTNEKVISPEDWSKYVSDDLL